MKRLAVTLAVAIGTAGTAHAATLFENPWGDYNLVGGVYCSPCEIDPPDWRVYASFALPQASILRGATWVSLADETWDTGDISVSLGGQQQTYHPGQYTKTPIGGGYAEISVTLPGWYLPARPFDDPLSSIIFGGYTISFFGINTPNGLASAGSIGPDGEYWVNGLFQSNLPGEDNGDYVGSVGAFRLTGDIVGAVVPIPPALPLLAGALGGAALLKRRRTP